MDRPIAIGRTVTRVGEALRSQHHKRTTQIVPTSQKINPNPRHPPSPCPYPLNLLSSRHLGTTAAPPVGRHLHVSCPTTSPTPPSPNPDALSGSIAVAGQDLPRGARPRVHSHERHDDRLFWRQYYSQNKNGQCEIISVILARHFSQYIYKHERRQLLESRSIVVLLFQLHKQNLFSYVYGRFFFYFYRILTNKLAKPI